MTEPFLCISYVESVKLDAKCAMSGLCEDLVAFICIWYQRKEERQPFSLNIFQRICGKITTKNPQARESEIFKRETSDIFVNHMQCFDYA